MYRSGGQRQRHAEHALSALISTTAASAWRMQI
jgi:hypothetical protein